MASDNEGTFTIDLEGETTGERFTGKFKTKLKLSHRDSITKDNIKRDLLGRDPDKAGGRAQSLAFISSELTVRIIDSPIWFKESSFGLDLLDDSVLAEIYKKAIDLEKAEFDRLHKKAEEAIPLIKEEIKEQNK